MAWTAPKLWAGDFVTSAMMNTYVSDNLSCTMPAVITGKGHIAAGTAANAIGETAQGDNYAQMCFLSSKTNGITTTAPFSVLSTAGYQILSGDSSETDFHSYSIPANTLGTTGGIYFYTAGACYNNKGTDGTVVFKLYYGATSAAMSAITVTNGTTEYFTLQGVLGANNATNAQIIILSRMSATPVGAAAAIDSTAAGTIKYTVDLSAAHASFTYTQLYAYYAVIKAGTIA